MTAMFHGENGVPICFALSLWNGSDPILKERLFGLTNSEGNHGEGVKECDDAVALKRNI
jgi:hypothetical protein